MSDLFRIQF